MSVQNQLKRQGYYAVSVQVTTTGQRLQSLVEDILGIAAGSFGSSFRECQIQVDPETSAGAQVRFGTGNVGGSLTSTKQGTIVQKGMTLGGGGGASDTIRSASVNAVYFGLMWAQVVPSTASTAILNLQFWEI